MSYERSLNNKEKGLCRSIHKSGKRTNPIEKKLEEENNKKKRGLTNHAPVKKERLDGIDH